MRKEILTDLLRDVMRNYCHHQVLVNHPYTCRNNGSLLFIFPNQANTKRLVPSFFHSFLSMQGMVLFSRSVNIQIYNFCRHL